MNDTIIEMTNYAFEHILICKDEKCKYCKKKLKEFHKNDKRRK
jgi:hypothetical protein